MQFGAGQDAKDLKSREGYGVVNIPVWCCFLDVHIAGRKARLGDALGL